MLLEKEKPTKPEPLSQEEISQKLLELSKSMLELHSAWGPSSLSFYKYNYNRWSPYIERPIIYRIKTDVH